MAQQHSPGPWSVGHFALSVTAPCAPPIAGSHKVCDIRGWGYLTGKGHGALGLTDEEAKEIQAANARLIAAAPQMLEALKTLDASWADGFPAGPDAEDLTYGFGKLSQETVGIWKQIRAAIAAAEAEGR